MGGYTLFGSMVFAASLLGPIIMAVLPWLAVAGLGLLPWLHDRAGAPPVCSACGKLQPSTASERGEHESQAPELQQSHAA